MTIWPDERNRFCCPACREPIPDVDTISEAEAERRRDAYEASRKAYRITHPHLTREEIARRSA